jgi:hypothetical protein
MGLKEEVFYEAFKVDTKSGTAHVVIGVFSIRLRGDPRLGSDMGQ